VSRHVRFRAWRSGADFEAGTHQGVQVRRGELRYGGHAGVRVYTDPYGDPDVPTRLRRRTYEWAAWLSPQVSPGFGFTSLIASWNASTPDDSWLEVEARVSADGVHWSRWHSLGRWAETDAEIHPTSVPGQDDGTARVDTDVLDAVEGVRWSSYQLRVLLLRRPGSTAQPRVRLLGAMVSDVPADPPEATSPGGEAWGTELSVPAYSQQLHRGQYPHWDSGGQSWCSPTSTSMVLGSWGRGPEPHEYAWVEPVLADRFVVHAARHVFDYSYKGAGNWAFNAAYAARYGTTAFVTRLRSLTEAERFVAAGVPLVATVSLARFPLDGAGYATDGHLLTIVGFDTAGNVICNDPASHGVPDNAQVRSVYDRAQFERVWLGSAGGVVYVVHPVDVPLPAPPDPAEPNW
jgi:hypothetical protein